MLSFESHTILKSFKGLCYIRGRLLVCKGSNIFWYDIKRSKLTFIIKLPYKQLFQSLSFSKKFRRLLRLDISYAYFSDNLNILFASVSGKIFEIDLEKKYILGIFDLLRGSRVLNLTELKSLRGFDDGIYFGEYFSNENNSPVSIYKRDSVGVWIQVFTFKASEVGHIHNIIPDKYRDCVWIFSGDLDQHAAIWKATDNFNVVMGIFKGKQKFRACVGLPLKDKLIYATDSQEERNALYEIKLKGHEVTSFQRLKNLEGSVIYGLSYKEYLICSTSVEPSINPQKEGFVIKYGNNKVKFSLKNLFNNKRGIGIKSDFSTLFIYDYKKNQIKEITRNKKDILPFALFQFGSMIFPNGLQNSKYLIWFNVGLEKNDCDTFIYRMS